MSHVQTSRFVNTPALRLTRFERNESIMYVCLHRQTDRQSDYLTSTSLAGTNADVIRAARCGGFVVDSAVVRSVIKNFSLAFFFPVCLTVFFFTHNRTGYDIVSGSIVVELPDEVPDLWRLAQQRR